MDVRKDQCYAALTGDVIKSSRLSADVRGRMHDAILNAGGELEKCFPGLVLGGINVFRGDSVQFLLGEPAKALRAALFFRASFKAATASSRIDMRIAIGIGTVDFMPGDYRGAADGEAYRLSGPALDDMPAKQTLRLALPSESTRSGLEAMKTTVALVGTLAERWTEKQALAIKGALLGCTQAEICKLWETPVSRQAIAKRLDAAGWFGVERAMACFEHFEFEKKQP
jgi:hypothetical protein